MEYFFFFNPLGMAPEGVKKKRNMEYFFFFKSPKDSFSFVFFYRLC
jgi:hypothetical protein